ncbi:MAG: ParB/RepB/Spo0J family partition protein [Candidatus Thiodiazotropha taylori]|nr:ParB/RepB/Spo0J family partition protein [Candidatus Thiodiazotropha endolucinida]MCW4227689.1 ParB/RepB/Spo0J family partition protein [Candidatus Thiodiazotropha taylori]
MAMPALPATTESAQEGQLRKIPVEKIKRGRYQPRRHFDPVALAELTESIEQQGVIQPVVLFFDKVDGMYELIAGERRWRASMQACLYEIPAVVRKDLTPEQAGAMSLIENVQREDLSPIEEALALQRLTEEFKLTHLEVAKSVGKSRSHVTNLLRLLELSEEVQTLLDQKKLDVGHAKPLLPLPKRYQIELATMAIQREWSVRILTERVNDTKAILSGQASRHSLPDRDPNIDRLERLISEKYCLPCQVTFSDSQAKGRVTLTYHSLEELQGLLETWGIEKN